MERMRWPLAMLCLTLVPGLDETVHSRLPNPAHGSIEENVKGVSLCKENECM